MVSRVLFGCGHNLLVGLYPPPGISSKPQSSQRNIYKMESWPCLDPALRMTSRHCGLSCHAFDDLPLSSRVSIDFSARLSDSLLILWSHAVLFLCSCGFFFPGIFSLFSSFRITPFLSFQNRFKQNLQAGCSPCALLSERFSRAFPTTVLIMEDIPFVFFPIEGRDRVLLASLELWESLAQRSSLRWWSPGRTCRLKRASGWGRRPKEDQFLQS